MALCLSLCCFSQNVSGKWEGKLIQSGGDHPTVTLEMILQPNGAVAGIMYVRSLYETQVLGCDNIFAGTFNAGQLRLTNLEVLRHQNLPQFQCAIVKEIRGRIREKDSMLQLTADWNEQSGMTSGRLELTRTDTAVAFYTTDALNEAVERYTEAAVRHATHDSSRISYMLGRKVLVLDTLKTDSATATIELRPVSDTVAATITFLFNGEPVDIRRTISAKGYKLVAKLAPGELNEILLLSDNRKSTPPVFFKMTVKTEAIIKAYDIESSTHHNTVIYFSPPGTGK